MNTNISKWTPNSEKLRAMSKEGLNALIMRIVLAQAGLLKIDYEIQTSRDRALALMFANTSLAIDREYRRREMESQLLLATIEELEAGKVREIH